MSPHIVLVGTVHLDSDGRSALKEAVARATARVITVEISRFSVHYRAAHEGGWLSELERAERALAEHKQGHSRLRLLERQLRMPFEWQAARELSEAIGIPCIPIDCSDTARSDLPVWSSELISADNLDIVTQEPDFELDDHFDACHAQAKSILGGKRSSGTDIQPLAWLNDPYWSRREEILAKRIRRIAGLRTPVVHIGGWMHLAKDLPWKTMTDRLSDLDPTRILITRKEGGTQGHLLLS